MMETTVEAMRTLLGALLVPAVLVAASCTGNGANSSSTVPSASVSGSTAAEFIIHVEKPKNIGEEDWANPTLETAWETACPEDLGREGFSWGGRSYNVSEGGMDATIRCDDGSRHSVQVIFDSPSGG